MARVRVPYTATWRLTGKAADKTPWSVGWTLSLPGALAFDFQSVHELHEDLLIWSEPFFFATLASAVTCDVSRLECVGPATSVGDEVFTLSSGSRGSAVPAAVAVPVRQIIQAYGKGRSGRFWLPPPAFADTQFTFQLSPAAASLYAAQLTTLFDGVNNVSTGSFPSCRFAVIHRQEAGRNIALPIVQPVDTWVLSRRLGTQDRRMARVAV